MDILSTVRKIILYVGLLVSSLLFLYPHWRGSFDDGDRAFEYDLGRNFITAPPIPDPSQLVRLIGEEPNLLPLALVGSVKASYRIHYVRQFTEVALTLLFTFGLVRALKKPAGAVAKG